MVISNCNSELCGKLGFRKEILVGNGIEKVVPACSINYYYKLISKSSRRKQDRQKDRDNEELISFKNHREKRKDWYKIITLKTPGNCIMVFSARMKVCKINQMETVIALKLIQEPQTRPEARILVDSGLRILENNSQSMNVFKLQRPLIKKLGYISIIDLLPGLKYAAKNQFPSPRRLKELLKLKHVAFSSFVVKRKKAKNKLKQRVMNTISRKKVSLKYNFYMRVLRTEDSKHYLVSIWNDPASASEIQRLPGSALEPFQQEEYSFPPTRTVSRTPSPESCPKEANHSEHYLKAKTIRMTSLVNSYNNPYSGFEFRINQDVKIEGLFVKPSITKASKQRYKKASLERKNTFKVDTQSQDTNSTMDRFEDVVRSIMVKFKIRSAKIKLSSQKDYGRGIITRRLVDGNLRDVYEEDNEHYLSSRGSSESGSFNGAVNGDRINTNNSSNRRRSFVQGTSLRLYSTEDMDKIVLKTKKAIPAVRCFSNFSFLFFLAVAATVSVYLYLDSLQISALSELINLKKYSVMTAVGQQFILARMSDICIINSGINPLLGTSRADQKDLYMKESVDDFGQWIERLRLVHTRFECIQTELPEYDFIKKEREKPVVTLKSENSYKNYTFNHAMHQMISVLHNLKNKDPKTITFEDRDVDFLSYNLNNGIRESTVKIMLSTGDLKNIFQAKVEKEVVQRALVLLAPFLVLGLVALYAFSVALKNREVALSCFYGFEESHMKSVLRGCEGFLDVVQNAENEVDQNNGIEDLN